MNRYTLFFLVFYAMAFFACEEIPPTVTGAMGGGGPVQPEDQKRQVLVEEFTGVRCINCPNGSLIIEDLRAVYGPQLVVVSIHSGQFSDPYPESQYDFRTAVGDQLLNYLGQPFGYPSAVVNRKKFDGQFDLQLGSNEWAGYIAEELASPPRVLIDIRPDFDPSTRKAQIETTLFIVETISEPDVRISVVFTENNITDHQLTPSSSPDTDPDYQHKHVLRDMATPFDGILIAEPLTAGARITRSFDYTLPDEWVAENVSVVVVVSLAGEIKDVLQAHEVHLIP